MLAWFLSAKYKKCRVYMNNEITKEVVVSVKCEGDINFYSFPTGVYVHRGGASRVSIAPNFLPNFHTFSVLQPPNSAIQSHYSASPTTKLLRRPWFSIVTHPHKSLSSYILPPLRCGNVLTCVVRLCAWLSWHF